ncbi:Cell division trigger factor [gamma proteobacterium IMCC2047]|nr:Cell division trigger factor [gamma proteobacterium IMCC2047]
MQVSVENLSPIERRLTVGVPAERIETEVESRLQKAAKLFVLTVSDRVKYR